MESTLRFVPRCPSEKVPVLIPLHLSGLLSALTAMPLDMARLAKAAQVAFLVAAAQMPWLDVVNRFGLTGTAHVLAVAAERLNAQMGVTDTHPSADIPPQDAGTGVKGRAPLVVFAVVLAAMLRAAIRGSTARERSPTNDAAFHRSRGLV